MTTLTASFSDIVNHLEAVSVELNSLEEGPVKDTISQHCMLAHNKVNESIMAFQFYDRMQQCLAHVTGNLNGLSNIIDNPKLLYNTMEWHKIQGEIRSGYTMESEKSMFDAILAGKTIEEAMAVAAEFESNSEDDDEVELF